MITSARCISANEAFLNGVHGAGHNYKIALYKLIATLNENTKAYTAVNEIEGEGYIAGGKLLTGRKTGIAGKKAYITWDDAAWPDSTIMDAAGVLIYNDSAYGKPALAVIAFAKAYSSVNGPFTVTMPPVTSSGVPSAIIRLG